MRLTKHTKKSLQLNVTSLIDVMFILLLFFVVTSTFKEEASALDIVLPKANQTSKAIETNEETLFISKNGKINFLNQTMPLDSFKIKFPSMVSSLEKKTILLKGDESVSYQIFISVFDILKENKIDKLVLAAKGDQFKK